MINWDMIDSLLRRSRPNHTGPFRVAIYSRMPYDEGQEETAEIHIKFMNWFWIPELHSWSAVLHCRWKLGHIQPRAASAARPWANG